MYELVWTALGIVVAFAAAQLWRRFSGNLPRSAEPAPGAADEASDGDLGQAPAVPPVSVDGTLVTAAIAPDSRLMALTLADELASLVSGLEGRAHHLIEAAPTRTQLPSAAEAFLSSVQRLRTMHTKLVALGHARPVEPGSTDVAELIASLGDELQQLQLGLELHWEPPPNLPRIDASFDAIRDAMLILCAAFLRAERGATRMSFVAERSFSGERPTIKIELTLERITDGTLEDPEALSNSACALDLEAADHLIGNHGGGLTLSHIPGKSVSAVVQLPVAAAAEALAETGNWDTGADEPAPEHSHTYGGALLLESDPALRAVLARELKASGRAVFACADGASAHTFLEATPDRFELLIVDDAHELDDHTALAKTIRERAPALKICLLSPSPGAPPAAWPALYSLQKPFGVHELRRKLASILTAG